MLPAPPRPWEDSWGVTGDLLASFFCAIFRFLLENSRNPSRANSRARDGWCFENDDPLSCQGSGQLSSPLRHLELNRAGIMIITGFKKRRDDQ